ncbi:MAG: Fe-S protein assembly chaperone HscA [Bradymonadia bacterium]
MKAVGIDLGTTNSILAVVENGIPRAIDMGTGTPILPSVVRYTDSGEVIVGSEAKSMAIADPANTLSSVKRLLGRSKAEVLEDASVGYTLNQSESVLRVETAGGEFTPLEISSEILKRLKAAADDALGYTINRAVITVPAYFDDAQRQATRQAARLAGLEVMRLINEPTAAALAYGLEKQNHGCYAIFDLGGGTFDISILELVEGVFEVRSTGGDTHLGGDDIDFAIALGLLERAGLTYESITLSDQVKIRETAEAAKRVLTENSQAEYEVEIGEQTLKGILTRNQFMVLVEPILERLRHPCRRALGDAELRADQLDGVVLVGGSTRSPMVRGFVAEIFGHEPICDIDPDLVVAYGAASQADLLSADSELKLIDGGDVLLLDVTPLSLGLETMGGVVEKVLPRCSQIPASRAQEFTTFKENQTAMDIHVVQGERELVSDCRSLARFQLTGIPAGPAGQARIRVMFQLDANGLLSVTARELRSGVEAKVDVSPSYGLDDAQVEAMLQASLDFAEEDVAARLFQTAHVEAQRVLHAFDVADAKDGDLLTAQERDIIGEVTTDLKTAMDGNDHRIVMDLTETLEKVTAGFAHRRMDRALSDTFKDMDVDDLERVVTDESDPSSQQSE